MDASDLTETVIYRPDTIDVWRVHLPEVEPYAAVVHALLSAAERECAERFHFASDRQAYIARHGALRVLLGDYLQQPPEALLFETGPRGKPRLSADGAQAGLHFSLSRSGPLALIAVSRQHELGVDVERIREDFDYLPLARLFLPVEEIDLLRELSPDQGLSRFFTLWTRMEACVKATGEGLAEALRPTGDCLWCEPLSARGADGLRVVDLATAEGFRGALAAFGDRWRVREREFDARRLVCRSPEISHPPQVTHPPQGGMDLTQ